MKIKCTLKEFAELILKCSGTECSVCILSDMCDGTGVENCITYDDIVPDGNVRTDGEADG